MAEPTTTKEAKFFQILDEFKADFSISFPETAWTATNEELYAHCQQIFPTVFFEILYENDNLWTKHTDDLLPGIDFKRIMLDDATVTAKTKKTIWKYLQLMVFAIVEGLESSEQLGDTSHLFEAIRDEDLHKKISDSMDDMKKFFTDSSGSSSAPDFDPSSFKTHLDGLMHGKIGCLAKEIASEAQGELGALADDMDFVQNLMKNPTKMLDLVKNIGGKVNDKIDSGELKKSELLVEAQEIMQKMNELPGMQEMLSKLGLGKNMDFKEMANRMQQTVSQTKTKERLNKKREARAEARAAAAQQQASAAQQQASAAQQQASAAQQQASAAQQQAASDLKPASEDTFVYQPGPTPRKKTTKPKKD
jgi:hypothetical protein